MKKIILVLVTVMLLITMSGCVGNQSLVDGPANESNTLRWAIVYEAGEYRLHEVENWAGGRSTVSIATKCCGNQIGTSYNAATLYAEPPNYIPEHVIVCGD